MALLDSFAGKEPPPIDGLSAKQRFFLGWANVWCQNRTDLLGCWRRLIRTRRDGGGLTVRAQHAGVSRGFPLPGEAPMEQAAGFGELTFADSEAHREEDADDMPSETAGVVPIFFAQEEDAHQ